MSARDGKAIGVKADGYSGSGHNRYAKRHKNRAERRRAHRNPECLPGYHKHRGWVS